MSDILKRGYNYHSFTTLNIPVFPDQGTKASTKDQPPCPACCRLFSGCL